jgi:hypothetical protein
MALSRGIFMTYASGCVKQRPDKDQAQLTSAIRGDKISTIPAEELQYKMKAVEALTVTITVTLGAGSLS